MSKLFDDLAKLDRNIADRWKKRTRDNPKHRLSAGDIDFILADVIKAAPTTKITVEQGKAIMLLLTTCVSEDSAAYDQLRYYVTLWQEAERFGMQPVVSDDALSSIADFLRHGSVSRILFKSPGTGISYAPYDYIAVGQLILTRQIRVFLCHSGGLSHLGATKASYSGVKNRFTLYDTEKQRRRPSIVHEATHIIQDWKDVSSLVHHEEADAFIAEAVVGLTFPQGDYSWSRDPDLAETSRKAAQMVIDQTARPDNKAWQTAYKDVVQAAAAIYQKDNVSTHSTLGEFNSKGITEELLFESVKIGYKIGEIFR